jgi:hypothetical protein
VPRSKSSGTDTWSCAMSQLPEIFRKHVVVRRHRSVLFPFFNVPAIRRSSARIASTHESIRCRILVSSAEGCVAI